MNTVKLGSPDFATSAGRLLQASGNGRRREMVAAGASRQQNSAYTEPGKSNVECGMMNDE
jgi:hypothetical protein